MFFNLLGSKDKNRKSIRIKTEIGDKYVNVNLNQNYESLDILSLKIFLKDLYRLFDSEYGLICGRVLGNGGVGLPNVKISVFIPFDENTDNLETIHDLKKLETKSIYPYINVYEKDANGKIYNLLPKYSKNRVFNGFPDNAYGLGATPKTPVGTFPEKEEILVNETLEYVYDKYLKYTTVTNESGDYLLCVPSNKTYTINMSCDITDIGRFSTTPQLLKLKGFSEAFFTDDGTKINEKSDITNLPNIDIQNTSIYVKPLWSQNEDSIVGINRLDFNVNKEIIPFTTVVGNHFTPNERSWWGDRIMFRLFLGIKNFCIGTCPNNEKPNSLFYMCIGIKICWTMFPEWLQPPDLPLYISIGGAGEPQCNRFVFYLGIKNILPFFSLVVLQNKYCTLNGGKGDYEPYDIINLGKTGKCDIDDALQTLESLSDDLFIQTHRNGTLDIKVFGINDTIPDIEADLLTSDNTLSTNNIFEKYSYKEYIYLMDKQNYITYQNDGSFITLMPCDRKKVITDENGNLVQVDNNSSKGVFTEFRGYFYVTSNVNVGNPPTKNRVGKIALKIPQSIDYDNPNKRSGKFNNWVWKHFKFEFGKIYSIAQFNKVKYNNFNSDKEAGQESGLNGIVLDWDLFSETTKGFDEQTNILFLGAIETNEKTINYQKDSNILNEDTLKYKDFYNHMTLLGEDIDNTINLNNIIKYENIITEAEQKINNALDFKLFRSTETDFSQINEIDGFNMFNKTTPISFRILLTYQKTYEPPILKWSFNTIVRNDFKLFKFQQYNIDNSLIDSRYLSKNDDITPYTSYTNSNDENVYVFDITIDNTNFTNWYNIPANQSIPFDVWAIDSVISQGLDDTTYTFRSFKTIYKDEINPNYI